jgi:anti-sigma factor RsiW
MSNCRAIQKLLGRYFDGELSPFERRMVEDHLRQCSQCRQSLQEIHAIAGAFQKAMPVPPVPSALNQKIMAETRAQVGSAPSAWLFLRFWKNWSFTMRLTAIGVVAVACYIGVVIGGSSLQSTRSAAAEMRWISMTAQVPIVKAYMGSNR